MWEEGEQVDWQMKLISEEADRLIELAADDAGLRADLKSLAERILESTADPSGDDDPDRGNPAAEDRSDAMTLERPAPVAPSSLIRRRPSEPLRELTLGRSAPARNHVKLNTRKIAEPDIDADQLAPIEARCRKKTEARAGRPPMSAGFNRGRTSRTRDSCRTRRSPGGLTP